MTDVNYADDQALLENTPDQIECQERSQDQTGRTGLYVNANKTEYMCYKQNGAIFTLSGKPLKLVGQFIYLCSKI